LRPQIFSPPLNLFPRPWAQGLNNAILDAQSMVHIRLDVHRNRLTSVDIWVTAFNTALIIGTAISGASPFWHKLPMT